MNDFAPETMPENDEALRAFLVERTGQHMQARAMQAGFSNQEAYHGIALQAVIAKLASREPHLLVTQMMDWLQDAYGMDAPAARKMSREAILAYADTYETEHPSTLLRSQLTRAETGEIAGGRPEGKWGRTGGNGARSHG